MSDVSYDTPVVEVLRIRATETRREALGATQYISKTDRWLLKLRHQRDIYVQAPFPARLTSMPEISAQCPRSVSGSEVAVKPYESGMESQHTLQYNGPHNRQGKGSPRNASCNVFIATDCTKLL
jgi:hypothetical protein